ncbi:MAG: hypothetical protein JXR48_09980, partial [Candidatus Delongbacteria bacterium]|nr:hypothetical protein [Candidatus Delongbacteria bacterium]MBN2835283.1 hypothetical protein [Candidatus Delongbacteria bacterium]
PVQDTFGIVVVMGEEDKLSSSKAKMLKIKHYHQRNSDRKVGGAGSTFLYAEKLNVMLMIMLSYWVLVLVKLF